MSVFLFEKEYCLLEPCEGKLSRTVLRGESTRKGADLPDQGEAVGGASGSPIFNKHGELVGVLWGGWKMGSTLGLACQARYLKEMYEEEVGL